MFITKHIEMLSLLPKIKYFESVNILIIWNKYLYWKFYVEYILIMAFICQNFPYNALGLYIISKYLNIMRYFEGFGLMRRHELDWVDKRA